MNQLCWCGNPDLQDFSPEYWRCAVCSTLISKSFPSVDITAITDENIDFYGKKYWLDHQVKELGLASIEQRSRTDLLDRCGWWLAQLLEFSLPPAQLLEIGCSHGAFLALAELAGFRPTGIELSQWVVEFAQKTFDVEVRAGPIERQGFQAGSFDVVCMFDVLEHLQDPVKTVKCCAQALNQNGVLMVQTPRYPARTDLGELQARQDPFLQMMLPHEHLFLFSEESVKLLLIEAGFSTSEFVPARFGHYDMMFVAAKGPLTRNRGSAQKEFLEKSAAGRLVEGFLSLFQQTIQLQTQNNDLQTSLGRAYQDLERLHDWLRTARREAEDRRKDANDRLEVIDRLSKELRQSYAERDEVCAERDELRERATVRGLSKYLLKRLICGNSKEVPPKP